MEPHKKDQNIFIVNEDELVELLSSVYTLGYLNAWERFSPNPEIYNNKEKKDNGKT